MDADRRKGERKGEASGDAAAFVRAALAHRRAGELERAREALAKAVALEPSHELARALLLVTDVTLGRGAHGSFHEARAHGVDLLRFVEDGALEAVARSALDPEHGPPDAQAIEALVHGGKRSVRAFLLALAATDLAKLPDALRVAVGLRARDLASAGIEPKDVPPALRAKVEAGLGERDERSGDWALLAGAIGLAEARPLLEALLSAPSLAARNGAGFALELLALPASRGAIERALAVATGAGEKLVLRRALVAIDARASGGGAP